MRKKVEKQRILILGGSGFIGNALYKELLSYFEVHCTYCRQHGAFSENQIFNKFCVEEDSMLLLLNEIQPTIIISAISGDFKSQFEAHQQIFVVKEDELYKLNITKENIHKLFLS